MYISYLSAAINFINIALDFSSFLFSNGLVFMEKLGISGDLIKTSHDAYSLKTPSPISGNRVLRT